MDDVTVVRDGTVYDSSGGAAWNECDPEWEDLTPWEDVDQAFLEVIEDIIRSTRARCPDADLINASRFEYLYDEYKCDKIKRKRDDEDDDEEGFTQLKKRRRMN